MPQGHEQRLQLRFPVPDEDGVIGLLDGPGSSRRVVVGVHDLSLTGAGLLVPDLRLFENGRPLLGLHRSEHVLGQTPIEPVHVDQFESNGKSVQVVGVRFRNQTEPFLQMLCRYLVQRHSQLPDRPPFLANLAAFDEQIDSKRVRRLLVHCCRRGRPLKLHGFGGEPVGVLTPQAMRRDRLVGLLHGDPTLLRPDQPCYLTLASFTALHVMPTQVVGREGLRVSLAMPLRLLEGGVRRAGRLLSGVGFPVHLEFLHPQLPGRMMRKLALEVGLGGLRFELNVEDDLLAPGTVIESAALRLPDGRFIACRCVVRHTSTEEGRYVCGVEFTDLPGYGRQLWTEELIARMNPEVEEATPFNLHEVWEVFERSGYLEEKPRERMLGMRRPFIQTWSKLIGRREGSRCWLYRDRSQAVGTISASRIYSNTWLVHHMAVDRELSAARKLIILADLFPRTAFQWLCGVEPGGNVLGYFDANRSFNQGVWLSFFDQQPPDAPQDVQRIHLWDVSLQGLVLPSACPGLDVGPATAEELAQVSADLMARDGAFVHRALDLAPDRLCLADLAATSLCRARRLYVARGPKGRMLGYGILESASPGANIFALYDTCRIVVVSQAPRFGPTVIRDQLFAELVRGHRDHGGRTLLYLAGRGDMPAPAVDGAFEAEAVRTLFSGALIPLFVEFLNNLWTQR